jgi:predicted AAA+ superfamily ATPase
MAAKSYYQVIVVTGPRQVGKTSLCQHLFSDYAYYNLEDIALREAIAADPKGFIASCEKSVIIDEVQHLPDLFSYIQVTVDSDHSRNFVLTGSSDFALMQSITQSLAGRVALFTLLPFSVAEVADVVSAQSTNAIIFNGLYPGVVAKHTPVELFYRNYYTTYIERDVRSLKAIGDLSAFQMFMRLLAGRVGCEFNAASLSVEVGVSSPTVKSWLSVLQTSYIAFTLHPYYANISKRLTKTPKIYFYDTGLLCFLLGINNEQQLQTHPLRGNVFENLAVVELLKKRFNAAKDSNLFYYREASGREVDVVQLDGVDMNIFEIKSSMTFTPTYLKNLNYLKELFGEKVKSAKLIYDGTAFPPNILNIRSL